MTALLMFVVGLCSGVILIRVMLEREETPTEEEVKEAYVHGVRDALDWYTANHEVEWDKMSLLELTNMFLEEFQADSGELLFKTKVNGRIFYMTAETVCKVMTALNLAEADYTITEDDGVRIITIGNGEWK